MRTFSYTGFDHPVREDLRAAHTATWRHLANPGAWWTGAERVAIAEEVRLARSRRDDPPWLRSDWPAHTGPLPSAAVAAARRIAVDAHGLDRAWCETTSAELGDATYVELVSVVVCTTAIDAFAEALGAPHEPLPAPLPGEPTRERPDHMGDGGAWVPVTVPFQGPNVARALSLAPGGQMAFLHLVGAMYAVSDFTQLVWDRPLSRPQVELVAARVSAVNECFY
ncbi:MAG: alkylhydroperoxidase-related (seleno)protein [Myxococcota bacterium]